MNLIEINYKRPKTQQFPTAEQFIEQLRQSMEDLLSILRLDEEELDNLQRMSKNEQI